MKPHGYFSRIAFCTVLSVLSFTCMFSYGRDRKTDEDGHVLAREWKEYYEAAGQDRPQTVEAILSDLIDKSMSRGLSWDLYDAMDKYYGVVSARDWKRRKEVAEEIRDKVEEYDNPVVTWNMYVNNRDIVSKPDIRSILSREELRGERNVQFYRSDRYMSVPVNGLRFPEAIREGLGNDYEYMLWSVLMRSFWYMPVMEPESGEPDDFSEASEAIGKYYAGRYPETAYVEFLDIMRIPDNDSTASRTAALKKFVDKYNDMGIRFLAGAELLQMEYDSLSSSSATSAGFSSLREECAVFEKQRKAEKKEQDLVGECLTVGNLIERMDFRSIAAQVDRDTLKMSLVNIRDVSVSISRSGEEVFRKEVHNVAGSYHVRDTVLVLLPALDDGSYDVVCKEGDVVAELNCQKNTISVACQRRGPGVEFYPADYMTGKPVETADVCIYRKDSLVWSASGVRFGGYASMSPDFIPEKNVRYYFSCSYRDDDGVLHSSLQVPFDVSGVKYEPSEADGPSCMIFKDRAALNPGDTLQFKAVIYMRDDSPVSGRKFRVWTGVAPVTAELVDAGRNVIASDTLHANDFGSVSGAFAIPASGMNGTWSVRLKCDGKEIASSAFTVDDFVLPTFTVVFDPTDKIYFPGDTVTLTGRLESYSGASLSSASVTYKVALWNDVSEEGTLEVSDDGRFSIDFAAGDGTGSQGYYYHKVTLRVTDATGETLEFSDGVIVSDFVFSADIDNEAESKVFMPEDWVPDAEADSAGFYGVKVLEGDFAVVSFDVRNAEFNAVKGIAIDYKVTCKGETVCEGSTVSGEKVWIDLSAWPSGTYRFKASACVDGRTKTSVQDLVKTGEADDSLDIPLENFFKVSASRDIGLQFGATAGPVWAVVQLVAEKDSILHSEMVHLPGICGEKGSLVALEYGFEDTWPDAVTMDVFYFRNGNSYSFSHTFERARADMVLPLAFSRFTDRSFPGGLCEYELQTAPGAECVVSVFDMATETFRTNYWSRLVAGYVRPSVSRTYRCGDMRGWGRSALFSGGSNLEAVPFQLAKEKPGFSADASDMNYAMKASGRAAIQDNDVNVRSDFSGVLAFMPFLRSDKDGRVRFSFAAGDRLSSYYVSVFAHDKDMNNKVLRQKMQVWLPVTVSVMQPSCLYEGDRYGLQVSLSNMSGAVSDGVLSMYMYDGGDYVDELPVMVMSRPLSVSSGSSSSSVFDIDVPENIDTLGFKVVYRSSGGFSDGIFVTVPVKRPVQTLYESHSALYRKGMDRDSLYSVLMSGFVNMSGYGAEHEEISIADMLAKALPENVEAGSPDLLSVSGAYMSSILAAHLRGQEANSSEFEDRILSYRNADGGFAWLEGGKSSPVVTASLLCMFSTLDRKGLVDESSPLREPLYKAVEWLDRCCLSDDGIQPWTGGIDFQQYLHVRSMYASVPFSADLQKKEMKAFSKKVRNYLLGKEPDAPGYIFYKARRAQTLLNLAVSDADDFMRSAGLKLNSRFVSCLDRYMVSLKEYAVGHSSGGFYYPNAVLPFRGLLESELYAHASICGLLAGYGTYAGDEESMHIADGLRLWMMVQKETQKWDDDPAYMMALDCISEGSADLMDTKVLVLTGKYEKPFEEILPAGNGVAIKCRYFREVSGGGEKTGEYSGYAELKEGDVLAVGDRVMAVYELSSDENRSFVQVTIPRHACLRPEDQLSGAPHPRYVVFSMRGIQGLYPYSYREVKADRTNWYFYNLPDGDGISLKEYFFVTQAGEFTSPVAELRSMYAPHYRANDGYPGRLVVKSSCAQ